jgi:hypothetical protein
MREAGCGPCCAPHLQRQRLLHVAALAELVPERGAQGLCEEHGGLRGGGVGGRGILWAAGRRRRQGRLATRACAKRGVACNWQSLSGAGWCGVSLLPRETTIHQKDCSPKALACGRPGCSATPGLRERRYRVVSSGLGLARNSHGHHIHRRDTCCCSRWAERASRAGAGTTSPVPWLTLRTVPTYTTSRRALLCHRPWCAGPRLEKLHGPRTASC